MFTGTYAKRKAGKDHSNLVTLWYAVHVFRFRVEHPYAETVGGYGKRKFMG
jgi:hypothetical protein